MNGKEGKRCLVCISLWLYMLGCREGLCSACTPRHPFLAKEEEEREKFSRFYSLPSPFLLSSMCCVGPTPPISLAFADKSGMSLLKFTGCAIKDDIPPLARTTEASFVLRVNALSADAIDPG